MTWPRTVGASDKTSFSAPFYTLTTINLPRQANVEKLTKRMFSAGYVGTHADSRFGPAGLWQGDYQGMGWRDNEPSEALFEYGFGLSFGTPDAFDFKSKKSLTVPLSAATFTVRGLLAGLVLISSDLLLVSLSFSGTNLTATRDSSR
jgi:hypothetical protein